MGIGGVETSIPVEIHIVGPILMIYAKITQKHQIVRIENRYTIVVDVGNEELLAVRRELDVVWIRECGGTRAKEFDTEGIRHNRTRQQYEEQTLRNDSEHGRLSSISIPAKPMLR